MAVDQERLRRKLQEYGFDEEEIEELVTHAVARDKVMTPEDKERLVLRFFEEMMEGIPHSWDAEGRLRYDPADMDRARKQRQEQIDLYDNDDEDEEDLDEGEINRN